jgi:prepilin signal peptidase PulO-like enzyme (type II secretory pathway)
VADLLPILSFIFLRGRCRYCQRKISWQYPLVELITALAFVLVYLKFSLVIAPATMTLPNFNLSSLTNFSPWILIGSGWIFSALLIVVFAYDYKYSLIPDQIVIPGTILALLFSLFQPDVAVINSLFGSAMVSGFFALLIFITKGKGMGWGDVKLGFFIGALLGWQISLLMLFIAFVSGSLVGIALIIAKKKKWQSQVPFGTFLATSTFICMLWGQEIVQWYLNMLL